MFWYVRIYSDMFKHVQVCLDLFGYFQICSIVSKLIWPIQMYPNISKCIWTYLSECIRAYPNVSVCIHTCLNVPKGQTYTSKKLKVNYVEMLKIQNRFFIDITVIFFLASLLYSRTAVAVLTLFYINMWYQVWIYI